MVEPKSIFFIEVSTCSTWYCWLKYGFFFYISYCLLSDEKTGKKSHKKSNLLQNGLIRSNHRSASDRRMHLIEKLAVSGVLPVLLRFAVRALWVMVGYLSLFVSFSTCLGHYPRHHLRAEATKFKSKPLIAIKATKIVQFFTCILSQLKHTCTVNAWKSFCRFVSTFVAVIELSAGGSKPKQINLLFRIVIRAKSAEVSECIYQLKGRR